MQKIMQGPQFDLFTANSQTYNIGVCLPGLSKKDIINIKSCVARMLTKIKTLQEIEV